MNATTLKTVRFSNEIRTDTYPRPSATEIQNLYYQEQDYRRFKEEKWLDELREGRRNAHKKGGCTRRRRDSLTMIMNVNQSPRGRCGLAQAA
mmetsp:Transcript_11572/g.16998  ORF Transcript_11572/g.16998 Transcript_11572/m.16998 type:complete len:92 (-) Transcript_11572:193-468(-)